MEEAEEACMVAMQCCWEISLLAICLLPLIFSLYIYIFASFFLSLQQITFSFEHYRITSDTGDMHTRGSMGLYGAKNDMLPSTTSILMTVHSFSC